MQLTKKDRLFLINQYEILKRLDKENPDGYDEYIKILSSGYTIFYDMIDQWIFDEMPEDEGRFVLDILSIYRVIEDYKRKNQSDSEIKDHHWGTFRGFDGNNETEYMSFTQFIIHTQGKFGEQLEYQRKTDNYNSHMPTLQKYKHMVQKWVELGKPYQIPRETILEIINS